MKDFDVSDLRDIHLYDGLEEVPCTGQREHIPGPAGQIEALTSYPDGCPETHPIAVIAHPHPLYGGSLNNKVVHILSDTFNDMGVATVRFNFRGVGDSEGRYDRGEGETRDLLAVVDWVRERHPKAPVWLLGFSFGAFVVLRAQQRARAAGLLLVAPPVAMFDFDELAAVQVPWVVVQGGKDEITEPEQVSRWVHRQLYRPHYVWMSDADHFFHGRLNRLKEAVHREWIEHLKNGHA